MPGLHSRGGEGSRFQRLDWGIWVHRRCEAAVRGSPGAGPVGARPAPPPLLPAAQSGRSSGASCGQSGAAGAAPGAGGRRASSDCEAGGGADWEGGRREPHCGLGALGQRSPLCRGDLPANSLEPAGGVTGNRARAPHGEGERARGEGPRRWSGRGATWPLGPSAAGAARAPSALTPTSAGDPGRRVSTSRRRPGVRGSEVSRPKAGGGGQDTCDTHTHTQTLFASGRLPRDLSPRDVFIGLSKGGDNRCTCGRCFSPPTAPPPVPLRQKSRFGILPHLRAVRRQDPSLASQARCPLDSAQRRPGPGGPGLWMEFPPRVAKQFAGHPPLTEMKRVDVVCVCVSVCCSLY